MSLAFDLSLVIFQQQQVQLSHYQLYLPMQENSHLLAMFLDEILQT
jgi:hypothetical protein